YLELLLWNEGREKHVLHLQEERRLRLRDEYHPSIIVHRQPLQAFAISREAQPIRTLQLAQMNHANDLLRKRRTVGDDPKLGILARGAWIEVHRSDEHSPAIDDRGLRVQAPDRHPAPAQPVGLLNARRTQLV